MAKTYLQTEPEKIPNELKSLPQWVCWKSEPNGDGKKPNKVPCNPKTGSRAKSNDPATWATFDDALSVLSKYDGISFAMNGNGLVGIDLDNCRDPNSGTIAPWALAAIKRLDSYTEISPSGTGIRIFIKGILPPEGRKKGNIEIYDKNHFLSVTGHHVPETPLTVEPRQDEISRFHREVFGDREKQASEFERAELSGESRKRIEIAMKNENFKALYEGDYSAYPSQSEGDQAFCNKLAFWLSKDGGQMDAAFRESGLYRPKWDERRGAQTYGQKTISKSILSCKKTYMDDNFNIYRLTELGNADRFADAHRNNVRYVWAWKKWLFWNGKRWVVGADDQIRRLAHGSVKSLYAKAEKETDTQMAAVLASWASKSSKSAAISALLKEASALLAIDPAILDSNPWLFNCNNCTINLQSGLVQNHNRNDFITKITPIDFNPSAECPVFIKIVHRCFDGDLELIGFVQRFFGYCLSGSIKEQVLVIFWGSGANGKTTIITPVLDALGDYAQITRPETLMVKNGNQIPSDLAKLKGARLVNASESEDGHRLAESAIKSMTGGEEIQARAMYADWFEFLPEFKILLCTNHKPAIRGTDHAIWRRIRLVPFTVTIPENEQDKNLPEKLKSELPGILRWIVVGAAKWLTDGLGCPEKVQAATKDYQSEQNILKIFLDSICIERPDAMVGAKELFQEFDRWRMEEGHPKITQTKFGRMLTELGFVKTRSSVSGRIIYNGIGLIQDAFFSQNSKSDANYSEGKYQ